MEAWPTAEATRLTEPWRPGSRHARVVPDGDNGTDRMTPHWDDHGGAHRVWHAQLSAAISRISVGPAFACPYR